MAVSRKLEQLPPTSATTVGVPQSVSQVTLLVANPARKGLIIYNNIVRGLLFIKLGATVSPTDCSFSLLPGSTYSIDENAYEGQITGVWSVAGSGTAQVTEMV